MNDQDKTREVLLLELQELRQENNSLKALNDKDTIDSKQAKQELIIANKELVFQNKEKEKRAAELIIANKELVFQNKEKEKRASKLLVANKELAFQNEEKEKRAAELIIANKELILQNNEKEKKAAELIIANEERRETNEYLENLINYANAPIIVWNTQYKITRFNKAFESITGRTEKDVIGKSLEILFPLTHRNSSMELIRKTLEGERWEIVEINILHIDGSVRTLLWNSATIMSADGETPVSTIAQGQDITDRKRVEEELRESQEKYSSLYETSPVGIYRTRIDGSKILEINNRVCEMLGFTKEEFLRQPSAIRWADPNRRNEILKILKEHGIATNFDADILKKDDSKISCLLSMKIFKEEGHIEGFIVDITDRKHAEDAVRQSRKELDSLFEASPEMICFIGFDGYFKRLNPAWVKTLGYPMDKLLSIPFIEFVHPDDREDTNAEAAKLAEGQRTIRFDNRYRCNDGSYRWLSWSVIPDTKEKLLYAVARDITEQKQADELLKITLENLERSNKELEQFAYVASHELQEPLRMVASYTQLLERRYKDKLDQDANDFIQFAVDGANRMQKLINDLLEYSRIASRGKDFTKIDISQVLGQAISNLHQLITDNTALVTNEDLPALNMDESQIIRVFQNLIENAVKFKKKSELPKIHISCKKKENFYEFAVRDNGIGIDMQFHDRIFTIFQRLHSKEDYPGTGIGLSICKRIIERHGGKIWFDSKVNEGTTFYFTIKI